MAPTRALSAADPDVGCENRTGGSTYRHSVPTMVEAVLAGVRLDAEWVGVPAQLGDLVDVEVDIDGMLGWGETIAMAGTESTLHEGLRLCGVGEHHEQQIQTICIGAGLLHVELNDGPVAILPGMAVVVQHSKHTPPAYEPWRARDSKGLRSGRGRSA